MDPDVSRFLKQSMIGRIATVSPAGRPQIMPLFFFLLDGDILMNNAETSPTVRNLQQNPAVQILFLADKERRDHRCLRIHGAASFSKDTGVQKRIALQGMLKYYAPAGAVLSALLHVGKFPMLRRYRGERSSGFIRVTPTSWEFLDVPT